jgi:hypothetical protein
MPEIHAARGEIQPVQDLVERYSAVTAADDVQGQGVLMWASGRLAMLRGEHRAALDLARRAIEARATLGMGFQGVKQGFVLAVEAALADGDLDAADEVLGMLDSVPPAQVTPYYQAHRDRLRAAVAAARGDAGAADAGFRASIGMFRELGMRPAHAMAQTEYAEWLVGQGRHDDARPLVAAARETLEAIRAEPWLARIAKLGHAFGLASAAS